MRIPIFFAALAAASAPAAAAAEDWRVVAIDDETNRGVAVAYADAQSVQRNGDEIRFLMQVRFGSPPPQFDGVRGRMRIECAARRWGSDGNHLYLGEERGEDIGPTPLQDVRPGSNGAVIVDNLCNGRFLSGPVDPAAHAREIFGRN